MKNQTPKKPKLEPIPVKNKQKIKQTQLEVADVQLTFEQIPPQVQNIISSKPNKKNKEKIQITQQKALRYQTYASLKNIKIDGKLTIQQTDKKFIESVNKISRTQENILAKLIDSHNNQLTQLQCEQIHFRALRHRLANIVNENSTKTKKDTEKQRFLNALSCRCGCERIQGDRFPLCSRLQEIPILGAGVILYFFFLKTIFVNILTFLIIYSIFAFVTNLMQDAAHSCTDSYCIFKQNSSDQVKANANYFEIVQSWLGCAAMIVWIIIDRFVKKYGIKKNKIIDMNLLSASDYAIKIDNLPYGQYTQQQLADYLENIHEKAQHTESDEHNKMFLSAINNKQKMKELIDIKNQQKVKAKKEGLTRVKKINQKLQQGISLQDKLNESQEIDAPVMEALVHQVDFAYMQSERSKHGIQSIQIIYNMQFSRNMKQKIIDIAVDIPKYVKEKQGKYIISNKQKYQQLKADVILAYQLFEDLRKKFLNDSSFRRNISTRTAIVKFKDPQDKDKILKKYGKQNLSIFKQLKQKIQSICFQNNSELIFKGIIPDIARAPEPSDIVWQNCQKKENACRILFIYFVTFVIILVSFGIMIGLQYVQKIVADDAKSNKAGQLQGSNLATIINVLVSIVIQIVNKVLWVLLSLLVALEYNHTNTTTIISIMNKSSAAMWINVIVLPIITNYVFNDNYYSSKGLAGIVFDYHITSLAVIVFTKMLDPISLILKILLGIKCIRRFWIKLDYQKKEEDEQGQISQSQMKKVYQLYEAPQFQTAQYYVFIMSIIAHAVFFSPLQPILILFALVEVFVFYWFSKIRILRFTKIPKMTQILIFQTALYMLMLAPIIFGVGLFFNSYAANRLDNQRQFIYIAAIVCLGVGGLNFFNVKGIFNKLVDAFVFCLSFLSEQNFLSNDLQKQKEVMEQSQQDHSNTRIETYYKDSNSLTLLGFQNFLLGQAKLSHVQKELQKYCESHVTKKRYDRDQQVNVQKSNVAESQQSFIDRVDPLKDDSIFQIRK